MFLRFAIGAALVVLGGCDATVRTASAGDLEGFPPDEAGQWERLALYIGINKYADPNIEQLSGCVNDAKRVRAALRAHGFERDAILTDENATRDNIKKYALELVEQVKKARKHGVQEPLVVLYYAGHGNKVRQGDVDDEEGTVGDNTFTTHDTDRSGSRDIRDDDVYRLLTHLQSDGLGATVVFFADSCHSASSFRASPTMPVRSLVRGGADQFLQKGPATKLFEWEWSKDPRRAFYGACADVDVAGEAEINGVRCGKFTQVLVELLESGRPIESYEDLGYALQQQFALTFPGSRQRPAFDVTREMRGRRFLMREGALRHARVEQQTGSAKVVITAGAVHGVEVGSRIGFYKDLTDLREIGPAAAIAAGEVIAVEPGSSTVRLDKEIQLPRGSVARVQQPRMPTFRLSLTPSLPAGPRKVIVDLAATGQLTLAEEGELYTFAVVFDAKRNCLALHAADDLPSADGPADPYVRVFHEDPKVNLGEVLLRLGQQDRLLQLRSSEDLLSVTLVAEDGETPLAVDAATGIPVVKHGSNAMLLIKNLSPQTTFHVGVLVFERERAPAGEGPGEGERRIFGQLVPPEVAQTSVIAPGATLRFPLPQIESNWHPRPSRMRLKIIATDSAYDFTRLDDIAKTPFMGKESASRGDGPQDDVLDFLEDVSRGKRGVTPKRTWATAMTVLDVGE